MGRSETGNDADERKADQTNADRRTATDERDCRIDLTKRLLDVFIRRVERARERGWLDVFHVFTVFRSPRGRPVPDDPERSTSAQRGGRSASAMR